MESHNFDVLVVGAGIAGLGAARRLAETGKRVALLEARERAGGRIYTLPGEPGNLPVELGAEFVHGMAPELIGLAQEAGLTRIELEGKSRCFEKRERKIRPVSCSSQSDGFAILDDLENDPLAENSPGNSSENSAPADLSFREYLERIKKRGKTAAAALLYVEGFNAADGGLISTQALARQQQAEDAISGDRTSRIAEGYARLAEYLLERFLAAGGAYFPSRRARKIDWQSGRVEISAASQKNGDALTAFLARAAIVTLPLGVLQAKDVRFDPIPEKTIRAADRLAMGTAVRVVFEFEASFLEEIQMLAEARFLFAQGAFPPTWWTTHPQRSGSLTAWVAGPKAEGVTIARMREAGLAILASMLDRKETELAARLRRASGHDWLRDPLSRGAYCYVPKGGMGASEELAEPVEETLFFAGEHTDVTGHWGTVHGALRSGYRAADQVLAALPGSTTKP